MRQVCDNNRGSTAEEGPEALDVTEAIQDDDVDQIEYENSERDGEK